MVLENRVTYPAEFRIFDTRRVITKYRLWPARLWALAAVASALDTVAQASSTSAWAGAAIGLGLAMFFVYYLLSRPMTSAEKNEYLGQSVRRYCSSCGTPLQAEDELCIHCGNERPAQSS